MDMKFTDHNFKNVLDKVINELRGFPKICAKGKMFVTHRPDTC